MNDEQYRESINRGIPEQVHLGAEFYFVNIFLGVLYNTFFAWEMGMLRCKPANRWSAKLKLFFSSDVDTPLSPSNLSTHYYVVDKRGFERSSAAPAS